MLKLNYIFHPYLIWRTLFGILESKHNKTTRVNQYGRYIFKTDEGLMKLLTCDPSMIRDFKSELESKVEFHNIMSRHRDTLKAFGGGMGIDDCRVLYVICRVIRPNVVVETGTGNGFSSSYMIQALEDNGYGELYSIDLHCRNGVTLPVGKQPGWVIPEYLRHRAHLILGESFKVLPRLLGQMEDIDIFLHDSRHMYWTMTREYETVWPYLGEGGLLLSHDVKENDAFLDLCDKVDRSPIIIGNLGCVKR